MQPRHQRLTTNPRQAFATVGALSRARDLLAQRGMHGRARTLTRLAELLSTAKSVRMRRENAAGTLMQQMRPSGVRGEAV